MFQRYLHKGFKLINQSEESLLEFEVVRAKMYKLGNSWILLSKNSPSKLRIGKKNGFNLELVL